MQKITIEPVTRIEGHAKVTIHLNGKGKVDKAFFHVNEWRGLKNSQKVAPSLRCRRLHPGSVASAR